MPVEYGSLSFDEAIEFFRGKINVPTERWNDLWKQAHDVAFMSAGAAKADLLVDLRSAVDQAISEGTTLTEFRKKFDQAVQKHGWNYKGSRGWRSRIIYEANLRTAYQAGRYAQLSDPELKESRPYWQYRHGGSADPRPEHLEWDGLVLPADDSWWDEHYPPNGWGCSCRVVALSGHDLERMGKTEPDKAPPRQAKQWTDPKTGEVHDVPKGLDPGWDYAPGKSVAERTREHAERKSRKLPGALASALARHLRKTKEKEPDPFD
ncbi:phage head morphogenesis protein [Desulfonatronovibrio hydrogenovorans]|uniref:phage head morphogenesis protein n=1 Tax=Desulfonatronovibrio hydrogenovorans TaxID=53245 RepID=UPI00054FF0C1|nr:phage minor head protein [Desulfonatronovibrio hydrogenovorans]